MAGLPATDGNWGGRATTLTWRQRVLLVLIVLGLVSGLPDLHRRITAEGASRNVLLVADQPSFTDLAQAYGVSATAMMRRLKESGVTALGVAEDSLASLDAQGRLTVLSGSQWLDERRAAAAPALPFPVDPAGTYVLTPDSHLAAWLVPALRAAMGPRVSVQEHAVGSISVVSVAASPLLTEGVPLGFAPGAFSLARRLGMAIVPRPESPPAGLDVAATRALYARIASAGVPVDAVLFAGAANQPLPGYPHAFDATVAAFQQHHWVLAVVETAEQLSNIALPGTRHLDQALGERTVRTYSIPGWMLGTFRVRDIILAVLSQVNEFNIRVVYLHPLTTRQDPVAATERLYAGVAQALRAQGYVLGPPLPFAQVRVGRIQRVLEGVAAVAGGLLLLEFLFPVVADYGYQPLVVLGGLVALLAAGSATLSVEVESLGAGLAFGGLAMCYAANFWRRTDWSENRRGFLSVWGRSLALALTVAGITFCGGLLIATLMGSTPYFLEWRYFRGVKLTFVGIPFLAGLAFLRSVGIGGSERSPRALHDVWDQLRRAGEERLRFKHVGALLLIAAIGAIYLIRSGNAAAAFVPAIEIHMRDLLERALRYRPREKDFLVGYPSVFAAAFFASRRQRWLFLFFLLGISAGQVALVDSFATVRTPFVHALLREGYGMLIGMMVGSVALACLYGLEALWQRVLPQAAARRGGGAVAALPGAGTATAGPLPDRAAVGAYDGRLEADARARGNQAPSQGARGHNRNPRRP
jgi:hypothetical protein